MRSSTKLTISAEPIFINYKENAISKLLTRNKSTKIHLKIIPKLLKISKRNCLKKN